MLALYGLASGQLSRSRALLETSFGGDAKFYTRAAQQGKKDKQGGYNPFILILSASPPPTTMYIYIYICIIFSQYVKSCMGHKFFR